MSDAQFPTEAVSDVRLAQLAGAYWADGAAVFGNEIASCLKELQRIRARDKYLCTLLVEWYVRANGGEDHCAPAEHILRSLIKVAEARPHEPREKLTRWQIRDQLKGGGAYLGAAREHLQRTVGGDRLIWGSQMPVAITVARIEEMALDVAAAALEQDVKRLQQTNRADSAAAGHMGSSGANVRTNAGSTPAGSALTKGSEHA